MPPRSSPSCFPLSTRTPRATGTSTATNQTSGTVTAWFYIETDLIQNSRREELSVQMSGLIELCFVLQDNPWAYLQRSEALYGDEPEAVWWLHSAVQGWEAEVSERGEKERIWGRFEDCTIVLTWTVWDDLVSSCYFAHAQRRCLDEQFSRFETQLTVFVLVKWKVFVLWTDFTKRDVATKCVHIYIYEWFSLAYLKLSFLFFIREKYKLKERDEMWHKIEELAKQNPQVNGLRCALTLATKISVLHLFIFLIHCFIHIDQKWGSRLTL